MKIEFLPSFVEKLDSQISYIAKDKPSAAREFKNSLIKKCRELVEFPYKYQKSKYFDDESIRDLIFMGYTIIYKIDEDKIRVFAITKYEEFKA
jgi:plasmid stabilization system protein ParE